MRVVVVLCAALLLVVPLLADSGITMIGGSGGAVLPTADVIAKDNAEVAVDWFNTDVDETLPVRIDAGIANRVEVGGLLAFNDATDFWGLNVKYDTRLPRPMGGTSVGARFLDATDVDITAEQVYLVHTHDFPSHGSTRFRVSVGGNWTRFDLGGPDVDVLRAYGSAEATRGPWSVGAEIQSSNNVIESDPLMAVYVRHQHTPNILVQAGLSNVHPLGLTGTDDWNFFAGATYKWGYRGAPVGGGNRMPHHGAYSGEMGGMEH